MDIVAYEGLTGNKVSPQRDNYRSLCPVHLENTPSFYIHKDTMLCHCFGCGAKGYLDNVLSKALEIPAKDIRKALGITVTDRKLLDRVQVEETFSKAWLSGFKRISMHPFLKKRGFKSDVVLLHQARWDPEGRIVFPIPSLGGPVVGAVGRTVKDEFPKWKFYWNTKPGSVLYQPIDTLNLNIIVEGILDVMWLNQCGYTGAAALIRSHATKIQIDLIKSHANEVILFLDNDKAGRIGQEHLANHLQSQLQVTYAVYPNDKNDPQELTEDEVHRAIDKRLTRVEYSTSR